MNKIRQQLTLKMKRNAAAPITAALRNLNNRSVCWLLALLVLGAAALPLEILRAQTETDGPQVVVTAGANGVVILDEEGRLIAEFGPGARLVATQRSTSGDWLYVQADNGVAGWAPADRLIVFNIGRLPAQTVDIRPVTPTPTEEPSTPAASPETPSQTGAEQSSQPQQTPSPGAPTAADGPVAQVALQRGNLNIRSGPGTGYRVIGKARAGQQLPVLGRNAAGDWLQVAAPEVPGGAGWVAAQYVTLSETSDSLPVMESAPAAEDERGVVAPVVEEKPAGDLSSTPGEIANPPAATSSTSGLSGKLVLQTSWGGDIYVYHFATGELRLLTGGFDPSISPDGTQVAFTRLGGEHGLYLINIDGSNERRIFSERNEFFSPKWSPDGQSILFMRTDTTYDCELCIPEELRRKFPWYRVRPRLARVDINGQNYLDIAALDTATSPDWNSAGVVYSSDAGIQITTPTSSDENRRVIFDIRQQYYQDPDWQPNGGRIVYHQRRAGRWALFSINPDGSGRVELNPPPTALVDAMPSNVAAAWSPDGRHIAFLSNRGEDNSAGAWGVWVMDADGSNARRLPIDLPFEYHYVDEQMIDWGP